MEKRMIWNNDVYREMDALEKDGFFAESEITSEEEKMDAAYEHINTALNDEAYNLSIDAGADIFLIGEFQRWNGRGSAYANLETSNIGEAIKKAVALFSENDTVEVFVSSLFPTVYFCYDISNTTCNLKIFFIRKSYFVTAIF